MWDEASNDNLAKAWNQLLSESPHDSSEVSTPDDEERDDEMEMTAVLGQDLQDTVVERLDSDFADPGHQILGDAEIVADTLEISNNEESGEELEIEQTAITPDEASQVLDTSLKWLETQLHQSTLLTLGAHAQRGLL